MQKFYSVHKRNGRNFILTFKENGEVLAYDIEKDSEKTISNNTVKRWHELGEEIKSEPEPEQEEKKQDKRKKVTAEQVIEIREKRETGQSINSLAKEYGMSYSGMYWIVKGNTWKHLDDKQENERNEGNYHSPRYHWYEYKFRGYSLGCQPKNPVAVDHDHGRFGAVAYKEPLTDKQIKEFELIPMY